jgi:U3 small nucleolar RNA-associated protein 15
MTSTVGKFHPSRAIATPVVRPSSITIASSSFVTRSSLGAAGDYDDDDDDEHKVTMAIISNPVEATWWARNFGLTGRGTSFTSKTTAASSKATTTIIGTPNANSIHAVEFSPVHPYTMAVASGPRVLLYNPSGNSSLYRAMNRKKTQQTASKQEPTDEDEEEELAANINKSLVPNATVPPDKTIPFPGPVYTISFRADGRLLAVAGHDGLIRIVDTQTKSIMRSFTAKGNVRSVKWLRDGKHLITSGDDAIINLWDVSQPSRTEPVIIWTGHGDSVRHIILVHITDESLTLSNSPTKKRKKQQGGGGGGGGGRYVMVTGSYDHSVRVWDLKSSLNLLNNLKQNDNDEKAIDASHMMLATIHHGAPVEALVQMTSNPREVVSAGGTSMKLFDIVSNTLLRENDSSHSKTITSVSLVNMVGSPNDSTVGEDSGAQQRLLSTGLDGFLRIYDPMTFHCLHGSKAPMPLLCTAVSPSSTKENASNRLLVTGSSNGLLTVRQRPRPIAAQPKREPRAGTYSYFMRGASSLPSADDYTVELQRKQRLLPFDKALRQFRYGEALDEALSTKTPLIVSAVLEELSKRRSGLEIALSNRDEETLEPILAFCARYIVQPRFAPLLTGVVHVLLDIYEDVLGQSAMIDELFNRLKRAVEGEVLAEQRLLRLLGQVDGIITVAEMKRVHEESM